MAWCPTRGCEPASCRIDSTWAAKLLSGSFGVLMRGSSANAAIATPANLIATPANLIATPANLIATPANLIATPAKGRGPRPPQLVDFVEGVDTGHQRYGEKFDLFRVSFGITACAALALFSPLTLAQTCAAGVQASNPTSVYVIDSANGTVTDTRTGRRFSTRARPLPQMRSVRGACTSAGAVPSGKSAAAPIKLGSFAPDTEFALFRMADGQQLLGETAVASGQKC